MALQKLLLLDLLAYEITASWWAGYVSNKFLQKFVSSYYAWKTRRKWARYTINVESGKIVEEYKRNQLEKVKSDENRK